MADEEHVEETQSVSDDESSTSEESANEPNFEGEFDADRAKRQIAATRGDRDKARRARDEALEQAAQLKAELEKLQHAAKTDEEKQAERLEQLEKRAALYDELERTRKIERAVIEHAAAAGISDIALALAALDESEIKFDDDDNPQNVSDALTALIERHPALAGTSEPAKKRTRTNAKDGAHDDGSKPKLSTEQLEAAREMGMSAEDYARLLDSSAIAKRTLEGVGEARSVSNKGA